MYMCLDLFKVYELHSQYFFSKDVIHFWLEYFKFIICLTLSSRLICVWAFWVGMHICPGVIHL